jgi:hypothetical protein
MKKQNAAKRNLFAELMEGVDAIKAHRKGKVTLRTHTVSAPEIKVSPGEEFFVAAREKFNVSRAVWANMLRVVRRFAVASPSCFATVTLGADGWCRSESCLLIRGARPAKAAPRRNGRQRSAERRACTALSPP